MKFNDLSIQEKAAVIKLGVGGGLRSLLEIRLFWDSMPDDPPVILKVNKSLADFVLRLKDPNREYIRDWENPNMIATHKMSWAEDDNGAIVYPNVQNVNGRLVDFSRPPYSTWAGYDNAVRTGDTIHMTPDEAEWFTTHYKDYYPRFNEYPLGGWLARKWYNWNVLPKVDELGIDEVRLRLYDNIYPLYYEDVPRRVRRALKNIPDNYMKSDELKYMPERDDIWAEYLLIPKEKRHKDKDIFNKRYTISKSNYSPSKGNNDNSTYYKINKLPSFLKKDLIEDVFGSDRFLGRHGKPLKFGESVVASPLGRFFGSHTISRGVDKQRGEYVSYYDLWDLAPLTDKGDESQGLGKPLEFYDRIYLDNYYGIDTSPENGTYYGGYLAPVTITPDEYKKGGSIHIKPENRGKFTALKKRTGHSAYWFKKHGTPALKKMATFALNARKWHKHAYGGPGDGLDTYMTPEQIDNARYIWNYITGQGISPRNAAVLMGNAMKESSLNPQAKNPNSSAFGYLLMIDALRKKADKYIRLNNLDKDLGLFDYYNYLIQNNIDDYMKEYNRVYNEMNRRQLVYNSNPTENNKINLLEYIDHYNKMYGKRVSENRLFPVSDLKEAYNNPKSTVKELTPLFEETFMKSNSGAEHDKRIKYAYDFLDYFAPDERAYEVMRNDPLNYDSKGNYILKDGVYNYALGGPIKPFSYLPIPEVRY